MKWKTVWTTDVLIERNYIYLFFLRIFCKLVYKVLIQIDFENKVYRCIVTNGFTINDIDVPSLIETCPEVLPVLDYYNIEK